MTSEPCRIHFSKLKSKAVDSEFVNQSKPEELCCTVRQKYLLLSGILVKNFFWISWDVIVTGPPFGSPALCFAHEAGPDGLGNRRELAC